VSLDLLAALLLLQPPVPLSQCLRHLGFTGGANRGSLGADPPRRRPALLGRWDLQRGAPLSDAAPCWCWRPWPRRGASKRWSTGMVVQGPRVLPRRGRCTPWSADPTQHGAPRPDADTCWCNLPLARPQRCRCSRAAEPLHGRLLELLCGMATLLHVRVQGPGCAVWPRACRRWGCVTLDVLLRVHAWCVRFGRE